MTNSQGKGLDADDHLVRSIRAARAFANVGQEEVAEKIGVSRATVSAWERGTTRVPKIARAGLIDGLSELSGLPRDFFERRETEWKA